MSIGKKFAAAWLKANGWTTNFQDPGVDKFVILAAPHTSAWDFPYTLAVAAMTDVKFYWMGKHTLFRGPMGPFMKATGGVPVDRGARNNTVDQIAQMFHEHDSMALAIAPEGTRSQTGYWKSGFYHIAKAAEVPIVLGYLDFANKVGGFGPTIYPDRPIEDVIEQAREFYDATMAYAPGLYTAPQLRPPRKTEELPHEESAAEAALAEAHRLAEALKPDVPQEA